MVVFPPGADQMLAEIFTVLVLLALFMLPLVAGRLRDKLASFDAGRGAPQVGTPRGHGVSGHRPGRDLRAFGRGDKSLLN